jgi:hypothetical protein
MAQDGLTDSLPRHDTSFQGLAYNNTLDRTRIELPPEGDPAASGVVSISLAAYPSGLPVQEKSMTRQLGKLRFIYDGNDRLAVLKEAQIITPSGDPCIDSTFSYNANGDVDYIIESDGTW